ncbi:bifunctional diaminohydroxyphosphoribosylaminopyrimidine deaminase/5-amino-6-(5-phosphoribosylamino)uracil reductase RibD [Aliikangiella sp. G2MR2-5]|uniref:bifunctional diaminohydroxyphosphoribosylaminopyrimidine deaminase/5-amino-6-(5-phosphoribosylamino)uracil reductase RibD n=1 Tax=Aliikangiella sp. G2MR2-5 TaxID=2788943 RepID=UPI0018AA2123|nr:bifunctional diaminohydroxyphosphoribosylaminopyrimidine deaminase/5-amino-6-(5-phosphoribosylamino)uracil reductase RibD [Aliikangiella sp. G2MR2-5]
MSSANSTKKSSAHPFRWSGFDHQMMARALRQAKKGEFTARPNPMVGCVITQGEVLVGEGGHEQFGLAHAEVNALAMAGEKAQGATCYVTLEPCAHRGKTGPCAEALIKAGVGKVVAAMLDPNPKVAGKGFAILQDAGIKVEYGLLEAQARAINPGFISAMERGRPWVICKLAMSLDGRTALANGQSKWITGSQARADVQKLRARQDAIVTGVGTLLADNPSLTVRRQDTLYQLDDWFDKAQSKGFCLPARILLDRGGRADFNAKLFARHSTSDRVIWVTDGAKCLETEGAEHSAQFRHVEQWQTPDSLLRLLERLTVNGFNQLMIEAGHKLSGAFFSAGLVDELVVYMASKLMGDKAKGLMALEVLNMDEAPELKLSDMRLLGDDIKLTYRVS